MTLVDTSVWISHFRKPDAALLQLLSGEKAGTHPFIVGELACGSFKDRAGTLGTLRDLPQAAIADEADVHHLLETYRLWSTGMGWVDLHVLAAAAATGWHLMTTDAAMQRAAAKIGIARA
jgi:predicted nucleic acid-binding protein